MSDFPFEEIESRWQRRWEAEGVFEPSEDDPRPRFYCIEMLPYPSGRIHMGHVRNYAIGDALAWFKRMRGHNVLHPMGWDSLGLPAENAAIQKGVNPRDWTLQNIAAMKSQLKRLGFSYAWAREIATCHPEYYRWNQWFFLRLLERGLAYRGRRVLNWCPRCATVLANEQVLGGACWRHDDTPVEPREMDQWFLRITAYAEELDRALDEMDGWPERVLTMQRNWIGRSEGCRVRFEVEGLAEPIEVFTTRLDTIYGVAALVLAAAHPRLEEIARGQGREEQVAAFIREDRQHRPADRFAMVTEKQGVFTGRFAVHPFSGERIPVWAANFVLMEYGTGAVMAVPAHDERDFEFAKGHDLPIRAVVLPPASASADTATGAVPDGPYLGEGTLANSGAFDSMTSADARRAMGERARQQGFGEEAVQYRLRDWGISRQRYWGTPIPIIHCPSCGIVPVPDEDLPVILPPLDLRGATGSPLESVEEFVGARCPRCGGNARRETDTMDTFVDSSWYFFRYTDPRNTTAPFAREKAEAWFPIDLYIGGIEHATGHLIYCRFFTRFLRDLGLLGCEEPIRNLLTQGMVVAHSHFCEEHRYLFPDQVRAEGSGGAASYACGSCGRTVRRTLEKMSKSKNNIVDPDAAIEKYGADAIRIFALFASPPEAEVVWTDQGMEGGHRFLARLWRFAERHHDALKSAAPPRGVAADAAPAEASSLALRRKTHRTIQRVTDDIERRLQFNTAVAALMEHLNAIYEYYDRARLEPVEAAALREALTSLAALLAPFAPHTAEALWERLGGKGTLATGSWPRVDRALLEEETALVVVQVNGKLRARISVRRGASESEVVEAARRDARVAAALEQGSIRKIVHVPDRLVNLVVT